MPERKFQSTYLGICMTIRATDEGETFYQDTMRHAQTILVSDFLEHVDMSSILDDGESALEWILEHKQSDPTTQCYRSGNIFFIKTMGFEYMWQVTFKGKEVSNE